MIVRRMFSKKWILPTILVIIGVVFLIRLGLWQLDRLEQRRVFNTTVASRWQQEPFDVIAEGLPDDLTELEYRRVEVHGELDYDHQVLLKERPRDGAPGVIVVTPLVLDDGRAILVARGWAPNNLAAPEHWSELEESTVEPVIGLIQETQLFPNGESPSPPEAPQTEWFMLNIDAIQPQMPYELLPVFVLQLPEENRSRTQYPIRDEPLRLDEGNHFSYAIQWFMFSAILGVGYLFLIQHQEARAQRLAGEQPDKETVLDDAINDSHNLPANERERQLPDLPTQQGHA